MKYPASFAKPYEYNLIIIDAISAISGGHIWQNMFPVVNLVLTLTVDYDSTSLWGNKFKHTMHL